MQTIIDSEIDSIGLTKRHFSDSLKFPVIAVTAIWFTHLLRLTFDLDAGNYGVISRTVYGLRGIVLSPLVHGNWTHLLSNTLPLFVLSALTFYFYRRVALRAFWIIYFGTGIAVWLFARQVSHIGASGVVYGLVAFIFWNGIFRRSLRSIILALVVLFFYSGMFMGILPDQEGVSWESHLLGSLIGVLAAFIFKGELEDDELHKKDPFAEERTIPKQPYFIPDVFEKTKAQRIAEMEAEMRRLAEEEALRRQPFPPFWNQNSSY